MLTTVTHGLNWLQSKDAVVCSNREIDPLQYRRVIPLFIVATENHMQQNPHAKRITIWLAYLGFMGLGVYAGLLGLAWPSIQAEFEMSLADQGILLLAITGGGLIASFYSGAIAARLGIGRMLMVASAMIALSLLAVSLTQSWLLLIVILIITGTGSGAIDAGLNSYAAQHFSERVMNWLHACFGVGVTITPLMMTAIFSAHLSWRVGYVIAGALVGVVAVLFLFTSAYWRSTTTTTAHDGSTTPTERVSLGATLRLPIVWIGVAMLFLCAGLETTPGNWIFTVFTQSRGIPEVEAAQWVSVYWASFTIGRIFFGAIISRVNTIWLLRLCMFGALVGAGMLWWNVIPWVSFAGLTLLGFSQAPVYPVLTSATPRRVGKLHTPNAVGFQVTGAGAGLALLPAFAGVLAERINLEVIPIVAFFAVILMFILYQLSLAKSVGVDEQVPAPSASSNV
jgi:fucose permease